MAADERWYFTKEEINNSPSRKCGIDTEKELSCRQQGAKLIQDMGQRLHVTQLVINTAIVYMHRFYMFHSFAKFHRNSIAPAALFLAAKVEEQPRKLEHVIKVAHYILFHHEHTNLDTQSEGYLEKAQELVMNENILLQTLGFDVAIDHPHTYVVKCFQMVRTTTELAQTSYFMATNSLHMTTMCLQYRPAVVACVCIYIVCKWSNYEIQRFTEGKDWFCLVDPTVTVELLEQLTSEFLAVLDKYPSRLKKLMNSGGGSNSSGAIVDERGNSSSSTRHSSALSMGMRPAGYFVNTGVPGQRLHDLKSGSVKSSQPPATKTVLSHKEYSEKREKERKEREKVEQKERFAVPFTLSIPSSSSNNSSNSATTLSHSSSNVPHSRTLPPPDMNSRKPVPDASRHLSTVHGVPSSTRHPVPTKDSSRKELPPSLLRSGDTKFEKQDRISDNSVKVSSDKLFSSSADHKHSSDWYHAPRSRDKKLEIKDVKLEPKLLPKDTRGLDSRELKSDPNSGNGVANSLLSDHKVFPKSETLNKIEFQPDVKPHGVPLEDIKPTTNSFIFNNDDFSLRDFLNPSAMPPEDIFDTESTDCVDFKDETGISKADMLSLETTHTKLLSPPSYNSAIPTSSTAKDSRSPAVPSKSSNHMQIPSSKTLDSHPTSTSDAKHALKQHVSPIMPHNSSKLQAAGNYSKQPISTGSSIIQGTGNSSQPQISSSRKKEKKSPGLSLPSHSLPSSSSSTVSVNATSVTASMTTTKLPKATLPNSDSTVWLSSLAKSNDQSKLLLSSKASIASSQQILVSKEDNMAPPHSSSLAPFASSNVSQKRPHSNHPSTKLSAGVDSTTLNERLISQPDNVDASANKLSSFQIPVMVNSGSAIQTSVRRHKHEHGHHKHKKKKKHKHKESSKHRDKEKKAKKHKKHKDKDKEKCSSKTDPGSSLPLKITLRTKGVHPQHESSSPAVPTLSSPHPITHTHSSPKEHHNVARMNSTGLKLTIPKSRLQVNTPTPDQLMANHEAGHQKMKLKLPKDDKDASRKRARDDHSMIVEGFHPSKMARSGTGSSSSYSAQVSSQQNWASQRH